MGRDSNEQNEWFFNAVLSSSQCAIEFANDVTAWHAKQKWWAKCTDSAGSKAGLSKLFHDAKINCA